jgi:diaminopimelate epimerase
MTAQRFEKLEGLGNDFILISVASEGAFDVSKVPALCDRRFGVGADGVLLVLPPRADGVARMRVLNADGSIPEMCGNGLRCVALLVAEQRGIVKGEIAIETDSGTRACRVARAGNGAEVDVDMGVVRVTGHTAITVAGVAVDLTLADAGNPHAISYRAEPEVDLLAYGQSLATHARFERGTNVEFVRWHDGVIDVSVWERGVGRTLACGTGACAVAAVACARGEAKSGAPVRVRLPGGDLVITHDVATGQTWMAGPAKRVFVGETSL